jgi:hypothetical protein
VFATCASTGNGSQHPLQGDVDLGLAQQPLLRRVDVALVVARATLPEQRAGRAVVVEAGLDREGARFGRGLRVLVAGLDVRDGVAIARDEPRELPLLPQRAVEQELAGTAGHSVDRVVDAHHGFHLALDDRRAKRREVGALEVVGGCLRVEPVPQRLRAGVHPLVVVDRVEGREPRVGDALVVYQPTRAARTGIDPPPQRMSRTPPSSSIRWGSRSPGVPMNM